MNHLVYELERLVSQYRNRENVEIEIRLGWQRPDKFDTNIGQHYYDAIRRTLGASLSPQPETHVHTYRNIRMITDIHGNILDIHKKIKLETIDFLLKGTPFDVRLSVCTEVPVRRPPPPHVFVPLRARSRLSWTHKEWTYDLTCVTRTQPENEFSDTLVGYEFELELNPSACVQDTDLLIAQSGFAKLCDVLSINPADQAVIAQIKKNHLKKTVVTQQNKHSNNHGIQQHFPLQEL